MYSHAPQNLTNSELAIKSLIDANIELFAEGFTDWDKMRAYAIEKCVEYGYRQDKRNPIADACMANNVNRNYYTRKMHSAHKTKK